MHQSNISILIADDDEGDRNLLKRSLKKAATECHVTEACDMGEAIDFCNQKDFDCAILDYLMPGQDGLEGVSVLHDKSPYTGIIMITGQGNERVACEAIKRGAADYIPKSEINPDSMKRVVENVLEKFRLRMGVEKQRRALENFSHAIAHDLPAPLQHIRGVISLIDFDLKEGNYQELAEKFNRINRVSQRMLNMIDALKEYNKLASVRIRFENISMQNIVDEALENLSDIIQEKEAHISIGELPDVHGHGPQLI